MLIRAHICLLLLGLCAATSFAASYQGAVVVIGEQAAPIEKRVAALLAERIAEPSGLRVSVTAQPPAPEASVLPILLGIPSHHAELRREMESRRIPPLTGLAPGP